MQRKSNKDNASCEMETTAVGEKHSKSGTYYCLTSIHYDMYFLKFKTANKLILMFLYSFLFKLSVAKKSNKSPSVRSGSPVRKRTRRNIPGTGEIFFHNHCVIENE